MPIRHHIYASGVAGVTLAHMRAVKRMVGTGVTAWSEADGGARRGRSSARRPRIYNHITSNLTWITGHGPPPLRGCRWGDYSTATKATADPHSQTRAEFGRPSSRKFAPARHLSDPGGTDWRCEQVCESASLQVVYFAFERDQKVTGSDRRRPKFRRVGWDPMGRMYGR